MKLHYPNPVYRQELLAMLRFWYDNFPVQRNSRGRAFYADAEEYVQTFPDPESIGGNLYSLNGLLPQGEASATATVHSSVLSLKPYVDRR